MAPRLECKLKLFLFELAFVKSFPSAQAEAHEKFIKRRRDGSHQELEKSLDERRMHVMSFFDTPSFEIG